MCNNDKITIKDLRLYAYHGVNEEEKRDGQNFYLDITAFVDLSKPCSTDDINDTVSYAAIIKKVSSVFRAEKFDLIERAAQTAADAILDNFERITSVEVTVKKPEAPIKSEFGYVAVTIGRTRNV